ncbi:MAG: response regulator transcription factor [Deltaproteobacteria bacterium]|nr:MAG: response regulator transcription factor [Deltaproteobacteria bacterium]
MAGVLVVEDCPDTRRLIERALGSEFALRPCEGLAEARAALAEATPDLVILDIGLPDGDGMALCSELRSDDATRSVPVIFLSSRNAVDTKVTAFGLGADDFVDKPFNGAELRARVAARLRRRADKDNAVRVLGPLRIDRGRFKAHRVEDGVEHDLDLTAHELRLLVALAETPGRVLSRAELARVLVGDCVITERTIDTHLCNLRRKLGPLRDWIETVRGVGYRMVESGRGGEV